MYAAFPDARPLAGATDLVLDLHRQNDEPGDRKAVLLDLWGLSECTQIDINDSSIRCSVTHNQVLNSTGLDPAFDLLRMACLEIGSARSRNRATVVGNIVTASPANDTISALVALDSKVIIDSSGGGREIPIRDFFFTGFRKTVLKRSELVRSIRVPGGTSTPSGLGSKLGTEAPRQSQLCTLELFLKLMR